MTVQPALSPNPATVLSPPQLASLPTLWSQLEPARRRQLAQALAELMRRIQLATPPREETSHDHA